MPPFAPIEISDDEGKATVKTQVILPARSIRAFVVVADINVRLEDTNSNIQAYKDDVDRLKGLLRSAEARLEKEQEKRHGLIEQKCEALDSGATAINARSGLRNGALVKVKPEAKREPKEEERWLNTERPRSEARQRSVFMGVRIPPRNASPTDNIPASLKAETPEAPAARKRALPPPQRELTAPASGNSGDYIDQNVLMGDYSSEGDLVSSHQSSVEVHQPEIRENTIPASQRLGGSQGSSSSVVRAKISRPTPTRGRSWRGGGSIGRVTGPPRSRIGISQTSQSFSRIVIHSAIGGQLQHTWPTPVPDGKYTIKVKRYCCLRRDLNWRLPSRPGDSENCLMFSARTFDWSRENFPLFIREDVPKWKYYGDYKITQCHKLPLREWRGFSKTQKTRWCKHMLSRECGRSVLAKHFSERELSSMDSSDWEKVCNLFEQEDDNPRHLRITARRLEFVRYNKELYDLFVEKSTSHPSIKGLRLQAAEKRKAINDDIEIGFPDDDYTGEISSDEDIPLQRRTRRKRSSVLRIVPDSDGESQDIRQTPQAHSHKVPSPPISLPTPSRVAPTPRIKEELFGNDDDLYSAPLNRRSASGSQALHRVYPSNPGNDRGSSVEMWEAEPKPWVLPTEDNNMIAASEHWGSKFDSNQLIRIWPPFLSPNFPNFPSVRFSRRFLSKYLGGCEQLQECIVSEAKRRTQIYPMSVYYCERAEWAPDLPGKPGAHGVVYATKSEKHSVDFNYSSYTVFCRRKANEWEYCGEYEITRRSFVPGEWSRVSPVAKKSWSEGFAGKKGKWGITHMLSLGIIDPGQKVTSQDGLLQLECQVYRCVDYNRELYDVLETRWNETMMAGSAMKQEVLDDED